MVYYTHKRDKGDAQMNFETRQHVIDLFTDWEEDLIEVFDRVEPTKWAIAAEELKNMFSQNIDELLNVAMKEYGYFD